MSKKNKKFKRNKSHNQSSAPTQAKTTTTTELENVQVSTTEPIEKETEKAKSSDPYDNHEYDHVKKDVRKILFIIAIIIVIFSAICALGAKTSVLTSLGDWIYKVANIQTQ